MELDTVAGLGLGHGFGEGGEVAVDGVDHDGAARAGLDRAHGLIAVGATDEITSRAQREPDRGPQDHEGQAERHHHDRRGDRVSATEDPGARGARTAGRWRQYDLGMVGTSALDGGLLEPQQVTQPREAATMLRCHGGGVDRLRYGARRLRDRVKFPAQPGVDAHVSVFLVHHSAPWGSGFVAALGGGGGGRLSASSAARSDAIARWKRERAVPAGIPRAEATASSGMSR